MNINRLNEFFEENCGMEDKDCEKMMALLDKIDELEKKLNLEKSPKSKIETMKLQEELAIDFFRVILNAADKSRDKMQQHYESVIETVYLSQKEQGVLN